MGLGTLDIILLAISLIGSAAIGVYQGIKGLKQTPTDYLLGGRTMKPLPLAMSLTVGTVSAITIMGNAGEMYAHGTQLWMMDLGIAIGMYFVAKTLIPIFYPLKMISLYHYIECRFHSIWLRRCTVILTLGGAYFFIGFLLFPPSLFLKDFTGLSTTANIIITGLSCSVYSSFGGVKAVVYTDVLQSLIMIIGALAIVIQGAKNVGGLGCAWDIAYHHDRIEFFNLDLDPYQRHSFWLVIIYGFFFSLSTYGVNQSQTQRTFSTTSVKEAQRVIYYAIVGMFIIKGLVNLSGIVIFANYVDCDPLTLVPGKQMRNITIAVYYVIQHLTKIPGLAGLFVASIYAAVLSSVSTQVNSMTALVWEDFLKGLPVFASWSDVKVARLQKILVMVTGVFGIVMSLVAAEFTSFLRALLQITAAVWGPMVGLFLVAVYLPWVKLRGAAVGFCVAIAVSIWIVGGQLATQPEAKYLPMSHESCPSKGSSVILANISLSEKYCSKNYYDYKRIQSKKLAEKLLSEGPSNLNFSNGNVTDSSIPSNATDSSNASNTTNSKVANEVNRGVGFYGVSYCLNYCWGVLVCIFVAIIVTVSSTPNTPEEVDEGLIDPTVWKWFTKGFKVTSVDSLKRKFRSNESNSKEAEIERGTVKFPEELEPMEKTNR